MWALLEVPTSWPRDCLDHDRLPPPVVRHLRAFTERTRGARVVFLRRSFAPLGATPPRFFVARPTESRPDLRRWPLDRYEDLLDLDLDAAAAGDGGEPIETPMLLVCTHGRHDRCCARWGNPFYRRLSARAGDSAWQCSHIGGDRFAANLLWLPWGVFYGRLDAAEIDRLLDACRRREILLDHYRGRSCHPFPVQAAEVFLRRAWGELRADGLRRLSDDRLGDERWSVRFEHHAGRVARVEVSRRPSSFELRTTCHASRERTVPIYDLVKLEEER